MTTYVLDSSAVLRYIDDEPGAERIGEIFLTSVQGQSSIRVSAIQWGEIAGRLQKRLGHSDGMRALESLIPLELEIVPASGDRAVRAAGLRLDHGVSYADGFAFELIMNSRDTVLVTADYDFKAVEDLARIEFLPLK